MGKFRVKIRDDLIGFDVTFAFLIYAAVKIARTEPANRRENSAEFVIRDKEKEFWSEDKRDLIRVQRVARKQERTSVNEQWRRR